MPHTPCQEDGLFRARIPAVRHGLLRFPAAFRAWAHNGMIEECATPEENETVPIVVIVR